MKAVGTRHWYLHQLKLLDGGHLGLRSGHLPGLGRLVQEHELFDRFLKSMGSYLETILNVK